MARDRCKFISNKFSPIILSSNFLVLRHLSRYIPSICWLSRFLSNIRRMSQNLETGEEIQPNSKNNCRGIFWNVISRRKQNERPNIGRDFSACMFRNFKISSLVDSNMVLSNNSGLPVSTFCSFATEPSLESVLVLLRKLCIITK